MKGSMLERACSTWEGMCGTKREVQGIKEVQEEKECGIIYLMILRASRQTCDIITN